MIYWCTALRELLLNYLKGIDQVEALEAGYLDAAIANETEKEEGTTGPPVMSDVERIRRQEVDTAVRQFLVDFVPKAQQHDVRRFDTAAQIWAHFCKVHEELKIERAEKARSSLANFWMHRDEDVVEYINRYRVLKGQAMEADIPDSEVGLEPFLRGLSKEYDAVSQVARFCHEVSFEFVADYLVHLKNEQLQRAAYERMMEMEEAAQSMVDSPSDEMKSGACKAVHCWKCGERGHIKAECHNQRQKLHNCKRVHSRRNRHHHE